MIEVDLLSKLPRTRFRFHEYEEQDGEHLVPADEGGRSQENSQLGGRAAEAVSVVSLRIHVRIFDCLSDG